MRRAGGGTAAPFGVSTDRKLDLYPQGIGQLPPFDQEDARLAFIRLIAAAANMPVDIEVINQSFKSFPLGTFSPPENCEALFKALDSFVDQARIVPPA